MNGMRFGCTVHTSSVLDMIFFCGDVYMIWVYVCDENNGKAGSQPMSSETENSSVAGGGILRKLHWWRMMTGKSFRI